LNDQVSKEGAIDLPLIPDYINRPMQAVSENGKPAKTVYEVVEVVNNITRVHFHPQTVSVYRRFLLDQFSCIHSSITCICTPNNNTQ